MGDGATDDKDVLRVKREIRERRRREGGCHHCGNANAPHDTRAGPMCSDCLSMCVD